MIRYSIIVPWHRNDELLKRALQSVPERPDVELIPIEDSERRGAGYARNRGMSLAKGQWLLFMDSDDFFMPGCLDLLDRHADDDADAVFFGVCSVDSETLRPSSRVAERMALLDRYATDRRKTEFYCRYLYTEPWGKMIRADFLRREGIRFDETVCANDYMFSVLCGLRAAKVVYDTSVLYCATSREGSLSSSYFDTPEKVRARLEVYWRVQQLFDSNRIALFPFYGMWMMCRKKGGEAAGIADAFCRERGISRSKMWWGCFRRVVRKRLRIGVPFCR